MRFHEDVRVSTVFYGSEKIEYVQILGYLFYTLFQRCILQNLKGANHIVWNGDIRQELEASSLNYQMREHINNWLHHE